MIEAGRVYTVPKRFYMDLKVAAEMTGLDL